MSDEENEIDDSKLSDELKSVDEALPGGDSLEGIHGSIGPGDGDESEETKTVEPVTIITEDVKKAVNNRLKKLKQNNNTSSLPTLIAEIIKKDYPELELVAGDINVFQTYYLSH